MKGTPGRETPATWNSAPVVDGDWRSASYQMPGTPWERCMSFERRGLPVAVWAPETVQLLEPAVQPSQMGFLRVCWRARRSSVEAVSVWPVVWWLGRGVRFARGANTHLSRKKRGEDGAPAFVVMVGFAGLSGMESLVWDSSRGMSGMFSWGAVRSMVG